MEEKHILSNGHVKAVEMKKRLYADEVVPVAKDEESKESASPAKQSDKSSKK